MPRNVLKIFQLSDLNRVGDLTNLARMSWTSVLLILSTQLIWSMHRMQ